jgi:hypothetical protein
LGSALMLRIIYSFVRRRIFPYPRLSDLRNHREAVGRADYFSEQMTAKISSKGSNVTEVWKKIKKHIKQPSLTDSSKDSDRDSIISQEQDATVLDNGLDEDEMKDIKQDLLWIMDEVADLHERVQKWVPHQPSRMYNTLTHFSLFIWRKPWASRKYGMVRGCFRSIFARMANSFFADIDFYTFACHVYANQVHRQACVLYNRFHFLACGSCHRCVTSC